MSVFTIEEVNSQAIDQFVCIFGNVIELCTDAATQVYKVKPYKDVEELCQKFGDYLDNLSEKDKVAILDLHPDLAGRLATDGQLTHDSFEEQRGAGLMELTGGQRESMNLYNERYKEKFGFPFIICVRENKVKAIIEGLKERYKNTKEQEISKGINEVKKICRLRILDLVKK